MVQGLELMKEMDIVIDIKILIKISETIMHFDKDSYVILFAVCNFPFLYVHVFHVNILFFYLFHA